MTTTTETRPLPKILAAGVAYVYPGIVVRSALDDIETAPAYGIYCGQFLQNVDRLMVQGRGLNFIDAELVDGDQGFFVKCTGTVELPIDSAAYKAVTDLHGTDYEDRGEQNYAMARTQEQFSSEIAKIITNLALESGFTARVDFNCNGFELGQDS